MTCVTPKTFDKLYAEHIRPRLLELCSHQYSNFVVQRVFEKLHTENQLNEALDLIEPQFERMLFQSRSGLIVKLVEAAIRLAGCQGRIMNALYKAFHATDNDGGMAQISNLILHMTSFEKFQMLVRTPNVQGSLVLQYIMQFQPEHAKACLDSILAIEPAELFKWATDPAMSRVLEALLSSSTVPLKSKRKLIKVFKTKFADLASDKFGSHVIEKCWAIATMQNREHIAAELSEKFTVLTKHFFAKFIVKNFKIELFKHRIDEWTAMQKVDIQRRDQLAADLAQSTLANDGQTNHSG
eukprot:jgi/Hompol1/4076/HPOL_006907-RA